MTELILRGVRVYVSGDRVDCEDEFLLLEIRRALVPSGRPVSPEYDTVGQIMSMGAKIVKGGAAILEILSERPPFREY